MNELDRDQSDSERFELRGRPRPVTRINRKVVAAAAFAGVSVIAGLVIVALRPSDWAGRGPDLVNTETKPFAPGLDTLPKRYDALPPASAEAPRAKPRSVPERAPFRDPAVAAEDQERSRMSRQARSAGVFFQVRAASSPGKGAAPLGSGGNGPASRPALNTQSPLEPTALTAFATLPPAPAPDGVYTQR